MDVISTVIISVLAKVDEVKVLLVAPVTLVPFILHWYVGLMPPFIGVAENVTLVPSHIILDGEAEIETEGVTVELTIIVPVAITPLQSVPIRGML